VNFSSVADQQKQTQQSLPSSPTTQEPKKEEKQPLSPVATQQQPTAAAVNAPSQQVGNAEVPLSPRQKASFTAKLVEDETKEEEEDVSDLDTDDDDDDDGVNKKQFYLYMLIVFIIFCCSDHHDCEGYLQLHCQKSKGTVIFCWRNSPGNREDK